MQGTEIYHYNAKNQLTHIQIGKGLRYETEENNHPLPNESPPNQMESCPTCEHSEGVHMNYANNK